MNLGTCYWVLMLIWAVFGAWANWPAGGNYRPFGATLLLFLLLLVIGYAEFGPPVHR